MEKKVKVEEAWTTPFPTQLQEGLATEKLAKKTLQKVNELLGDPRSSRPHAQRRQTQTGLRSHNEQTTRANEEFMQNERGPRSSPEINLNEDHGPLVIVRQPYGNEESFFPQMGQGLGTDGTKEAESMVLVEENRAHKRRAV